MKLKVTLVLVFLILTATICSCSTSDMSDDGITIVCTAFPHYDWLRQIIGENPADIELKLLLDKGLDLHNYQPSTDDIIKISTCDMFIYIGGESESWVGDVMKTAVNKDMLVINLIDVLGESAKYEVIKEGMEHDHEHDHDEISYDEHIWLSLKNAEKICSYLTEKICELDSANADIYKFNADEYKNKLAVLDNKYNDMITAAPCKVMLFGDRFPFRYLIDDYGLDYYAAFVGCSAETEASFETITFLVDKINELDLRTVITVDGSDQSIAKTIIQNSDDKTRNIQVLNSIQSLTADEISGGTTYLSIMEHNFDVLKDVLYQAGE
jgi:ABC-type metal ion transport system, periplasmic component/surface adhesin